jgi:hypothetical protein
MLMRGLGLTLGENGTAHLVGVSSIGAVQPAHVAT